MKYKIKPRLLTPRSRFNRRDFPDYTSFKNAVFAAYKENPNDPDPEVRWLSGLIERVDNLDHSQLVEITNMPEDELRKLLFGD